MLPMLLSPLSRYCAWSIILVLAATAAPAESQAREQCTTGGPLTMDQVAASAKLYSTMHGAPTASSGDSYGPMVHEAPNRFAPVVAAITNCHVSFTMDIAALDMLAGEHLPEIVLDAINKDTSARLSLEDAHKEVAAIERYLHGDAAGAASAWEPVRAKIEGDYQTKMAESQRAAQAPKGEFETEAAYQIRVSSAKGATTPLEQAYSSNVAAYGAPFASRIRVLGAKTYPIAAQSAWGSYDADAQMLKVRVNGQEYYFSGVVPDVARNYKEHWNTLQTGRKYDDDGTRFLFFTVTGPRLLGQTPQAIQDQASAGVWVDSQTELMWTMKSSGERMSAPGAMKYCRMLPLAGFSDWRLPTIDELESLTVDPNLRGAKSQIVITAPDSKAVWSATAPHQELVQPLMNYGGRQATDPLSGAPLNTVVPLKYGYFAFGIPDGYWKKTAPGETLPAVCVRQSGASTPASAAPPGRAASTAPQPQQNGAGQPGADSRQAESATASQETPEDPSCNEKMLTNVGMSPVKVQVQFDNESDSERKLFRIDAMAIKHSNGSVNPHSTSKVFNGFAGQVWLVEDQNQKCVVKIRVQSSLNVTLH